MTAGVTVVVPTRNRREVLAQTLTSILGQRDVDLRVVVIDEGSSDDTPAYLASLGDDRVTVVRHELAKGLPAARNAGIAAATTEWVAFCDDDDLWAPDKLWAQLAALEADPSCRWSCTGAVSVDADLGVMGYQRPPASADIAEVMRSTNVVPAGGSSVVVDRKLAHDVGGFDESMRACEDFDMWCRLAAASPIAAVDRPLVAYRVWPGSMSSDPRRMRHWHDLVVSRYGGVDRASELDKEQYLGRFLLRQGRRWEAARHFARIAWRFKLPTHVVHATVAALHPPLAAWWADKRERDGVPTEWRTAAEAWLWAPRHGFPHPAAALT